MTNISHWREELKADVLADVDQLLDWLEGQGSFTLRQAEAQILNWVQTVGNRVLQGVINQAGKGYEGPRLPCSCGGVRKFVNYRQRQILTMLGVIHIPRAYYHCASCETGYTPLDGRLEIGNLGLSEGVQRALGRLSGYMSFQEAVETLEEIMHLSVGHETARAVTEAIGAELLVSRRKAVERAWAGEPVTSTFPQRPERLYIAIDGTAVHTLLGWKEIKIAAVYDVEGQVLDSESGRLVDRPKTTTYIATFSPAEEFGRWLWIEACRRGVEQALEVIVLGDGAPWIWNLVQTHFPDAIEILDWYHASSHIWEVGKALYGEGTERTECWVKRQLRCLSEGRVYQLIYELQSFTDLPIEQGQIVDKAASYFSTNSQRMRYDEYLAKGYHIGSGKAESACGHVIGSRLKQPGMRWSLEGAEYVAQVRTCLKSGRWDSFWQRRHPTPRRYRREP